MSAPQKKKPSSDLDTAVGAVMGLILGLVVALVMNLSIPIGIAVALPLSAATGLAFRSESGGSR